MTEQFDPTEIPTRPDGQVPVQLCKHCRLAYGDHAQTIQPQNSLPCKGTRKGFTRDDGADHVR